jgi:hypothetical protein
MAKTPESAVKAKVVAQLKELGAYYFYPVTSGYGSSGVFDLVVCYRGWFVGIECKADMKKRGPTKLQSVNARQAKTSGGMVLLLDNSNCHTLSSVLKSLPENTHGFTEGPDGKSFWPFDGVTA